MKTKGLVRGAALALALGFAPAGLANSTAQQAGDEILQTSLLDEAVAQCDCCDSCDCDDCVSCGCDPARVPFFFAGTEMTILNLNARSGGIITASFSDTTAPGVATTAFTDGNGVNDVFTYAPRVWAGRQFGEKWGIVGRFWTLETSDQNTPPALNPAIPTVGTNFATIFETDRAHLRTVDLELVRSFRPGKWKIDGTLGARQRTLASTPTFSPSACSRRAIS